jgi:predicted outer membrane protein
MKIQVLSTFCVLAVASFAFAQEPAPATPPAPGTSSTTATADKSKALTSNDKAFLKKVLEGMYFEMSLTEKRKNENAKLEGTKTLAGKMSSDLQKIWGELAAMFDPKEIPNELAGSDKTKAQRISKAGDKYDKELLEVLEKETKQLEKAFESASKSSQNPTIKQVTNNWLPTIKGHGEEIAKVSKEASKAK